jgi:hypothetical protein
MIANEKYSQEVQPVQNITQESKDTDWDVLASKNLNFFVSLNHDYIPVENRNSKNESNSEEITNDFNFSNKEALLADYQTGIFY